MSMAYTRGVGSMLCCEVLIGKPYKAPLKTGASLHQPHKYTSHVSDASCQEVVIFDMHAILPRYVVHFKKDKGRGGRGGGALQEALVGLGGGGGVGGVFGGMGGGGGVDPGVTAFSGQGQKLGGQQSGGNKRKSGGSGGSSSSSSSSSTVWGELL